LNSKTNDDPRQQLDTDPTTSEKSELNPQTYTVGSFNGIGTTIYDNIVPFLGILLGSAGVIQGLIVSIKQLGGALMNPVWGRLSDYFGRRCFLMLGNLFLAILSFITPFSPDPVFLLGLLVFETLALSIINPTWNGYLGDITSVSKRGRMLSRIGFSITIIGNLGLLITMVFLGNDDPAISTPEILILPFFVAGTSYFVAMVVAYFLPTKNLRKRPKTVIPSISFKDMKFTPIYARLLLIETIFFLAWSSAWPVYPYITIEVANSWLDIGLLTFAMALTIALSQYAGGNLISKFGSKKIIVVSRIAIVIAPILFLAAAIFDSIEIIYISNAIVGLSLGASGIAIVTIILNNAPEESKATYMALYAMFLGIAGFIGSTTMGGILQFLSGNNKPSLGVLTILLLLVAFARLFSWFSYFFLLQDKREISN
jgi:MFS family permease